MKTLFKDGTSNFPFWSSYSIIRTLNEHHFSLSIITIDFMYQQNYPNNSALHWISIIIVWNSGIQVWLICHTIQHQKTQIKIMNWLMNNKHGYYLSILVLRIRDVFRLSMMQIVFKIHMRIKYTEKTSIEIRLPFWPLDAWFTYNLWTGYQFVSQQ